jgi:hypothetical protein
MPDLGGMFSGFIEAAVTLALLFIIIGWVSSKLVEVVQTLVNSHGKMLRSELQRCFGNDEQAKRFTKYFYWHPLIEPLTQPGMGALPGWLRPGEMPTDYPPGRLPAYIGPETFSAAMLNPFPWPPTKEPLAELLSANLTGDPAPMEDFAEQLSQDRKHVGVSGTWNMLLRNSPSPVPVSAYDPHFRLSPVNIYASGRVGGRDLLTRLTAVWSKNNLVPPDLRSLMLTFVQNAEGDIDRLRASVARWYGEAMDRVTGRFKRNAWFFVFLTAALICFLFNVNTIAIFQAIAGDPDRAALQRAEAAGGTAEDLATIEAKRRFAAVVTDHCNFSAPPQDQCLVEALRSLWRNPDYPNIVRAISFTRPFDPAWQQTQLRRVRTYCLSDKRADFCSSSLVADLTKCLEGPTNAKGEPIPRPDEVNAATDWESKRNDFCRHAWGDIWSNAAFFWDAATASDVARGLFGGPAHRQGLATQLRAVRETAVRDVRIHDDHIADVPGAGFILGSDEGMAEQAGDRVRGLIGILLSALLAAFGAPFWYDLLGRISRRGATGPKPAGG